MEVSTKVKEVIPRKKNADHDSYYNALVVLTFLVSLLLLAVVVLCANSIVLTVKIYDLKAEIDKVKRSKGVKADEIENLNPGLSQLLDVISNESEQVAGSVYPDANSSLDTIFQQILQAIPIIDSMKQESSSLELLSKQKRSISSLSACFKVVTDLQLLTNGQVQLINVLSDQLLQDVSAINNRNLQLTDDIRQVNAFLQQEVSSIQQVNASLQQEISSIQQVNALLAQQLIQARDELNDDIQQVNASFSQQQLQDRQEILSLESDIQQVNISLLVFTQEQLQYVNSRIDQLNVSLIDVQTFAEQTVFRLEALGEFPTFPAPSCAGIAESLPSGDYYVKTFNGSAVRVFCDMTLPCGGFTGGWQRVIDLDFSNRGDPCPGGFAERNEGNLLTCQPTNTGAGCTSVTELSTSDVTYSRVCGKVIGYQDSTPDAFNSFMLDIAYLDGVSLTHGNNPRVHVWSFAAGATESRDDQAGCPCVTTNTVPSPSSVGNNYFCESAAATVTRRTFFPNDPLWDGLDCPGAEDPCCNFNNPPWFFRELQSTIDPIEMRVCRDQGSRDEGTPIGSIEIYVRP